MHARMSWIVSLVLASAIIVQIAIIATKAWPADYKQYQYHNDAELKKMVDQALEEMKEDDVHSRIMAINEAHQRYQDSKQADIDQDIDVDENIIETNLEQGVNLFEGDIDLSPQEIAMIKKTGTLQKRTAGQQSDYQLWHDRMIPYLIAPSLKSKRHLIRQATSIIQRDTCLKFYEMQSHSSRGENYIYIDSRKGCHSKIGKSSSKQYQILSLGMGCDGVQTIIHELTHAIGFWHEQARHDRDKYVRVLWENIQPGTEYNFERHDISSVDTLNLPYDYQSIMHYGTRSFTRNGGNTLERIDDPKAKLGRTTAEYSSYDKLAINALYECTKYPGNYRGFSSWSDWMPCNWQCKRYRTRFCMNVANPYWREKLCPGADSYGVHVEYKDCSPAECGPIDGGWSMWLGWSQCNAKCGEGTRTRERKCENPHPMRDGKQCPAKDAKQTEKCTSGKCKLGYYETQFDGSTGSWNIKDDGSRYKKWRIESDWRNPGPKGDHTTGKGQWLYFPTAYMNFDKNPNGVGKLVNTFGWGNPFCLTFYYVMDGPSVGSLTVNIKILMRNDKRQWRVFTATGSKGKNWHLAEVYINVKNKNFQISIDAVGSGNKEQGTIALDDLYIIYGRCPSIPTVKPTVPPCVDINLKCKGWTLDGECEKNPGYMKKFCRRSCVCGPNPGCKDTHKKCAYWADKDECNKNPGWMKKNCCVSCRQAASCTDTKKYKDKCPNWAAKDECRKNAKWMKKNCCRSCKKQG